MAIYQCKNCQTLIKQNYVEKCQGCGSRHVVYVEGRVLDQESEKIEYRNEQNDNQLIEEV